MRLIIAALENGGAKHYKCLQIFFVLFLQVTRQMKKSLSTLGYTEQDVNQMSPSEAHDVVNRGVKKDCKITSKFQGLVLRACHYACRTSG